MCFKALKRQHFIFETKRPFAKAMWWAEWYSGIWKAAGKHHPPGCCWVKYCTGKLEDRPASLHRNGKRCTFIFERLVDANGGRVDGRGHKCSYGMWKWDNTSRTYQGKTSVLKKRSRKCLYSPCLMDCIVLPSLCLAQPPELFAIIESTMQTAQTRWESLAQESKLIDTWKWH